MIELVFSTKKKSKSKNYNHRSAFEKHEKSAPLLSHLI